MADDTAETMPTLTEIRKALLDAALPHVVFDGWSEATLKAAIADSGMDPELARAAFPRGAADLVLEFHFDGDRQLAEALASTDLAAMRYSERVAFAVRRRLEIAAPEKEAVRRGASFFALPQHASDGAKAVWHTADVIWTGLGDSSRDMNWYTKRMTLSGIISATTLYWLGDESEGSERTWDFLERRIADVMRFEKAKAALKDNPLRRMMRAGPLSAFARMREKGPRAPWTGPGPGRPGVPAGPLPDKVEPGA
ncbi:COQ9 family protein [Oceanicella sp. SM1341]|uniref:COQ9 family protein n=1 Tax=Oceanicella sp. SM1341 TaxID=1548889 RepID=UPI001E59E071|nr:COQ9 family protein [Oceanicella sp. SM1341]